MPAQLPPAQLFLLHAIFVFGLLMWLPLAFAGFVPQGSSFGSVVLRQLGLAPSRPLVEVAIGLLLSPLVWVLLVGCLLVVMATLFTFGAQDLLPKQPPALVLWIAGLPLWLKVAVALSAGVVEEIFFRGMLQPRVGVAVSTLLFVLAHLSYDQPFMLVGVTVLSLVFAGLVWWRQNVWPAIVAHFLFDAFQLLFVIPWALEQWPSGAKGLGPLANAALAIGGVPWLP
jgi:membrane protease YdiL (CAAX protease family)